MPTIEGDDIPSHDVLAKDDDMPMIGDDICKNTLAEGDDKKKSMGTKKKKKILSEKVGHSNSSKYGDMQNQLQ
eukprot:7690075-Ditylum_brightwellii.AAC.1